MILSLITLCATGLYIAHILGSDNSFCKPTDTVYTVILESKEEWFDYFRSIDPSDIYRYPLRYYHPRFVVPGRSGYYAVSVDWSETMEPILYVSTFPSWQNSPVQGTEGYIIISSAEIPSNHWSQSYNVHRLSENIFCYSTRARQWTDESGSEDNWSTPSLME